MATSLDELEKEVHIFLSIFSGRLSSHVISESTSPTFRVGDVWDGLLSNHSFCDQL